MSKSLKLLFALLISVFSLVLFSAGVSASTPVFGPNLLVTDATTTSSSSSDGPPILDIDIAGGVYVAWIDHRSSKTEIFFSKLNPNSSGFSSNTPLTGINDQKSFPQIEEDGGIIYIAWNEKRVVDGNVQSGIFFTKSTDSGQTFSEEVFLDGSGSLPISMVARDGKIYIAYSKESREIWLASSNDQGSNFSKKKVSDSTSSGRLRPTVDFTGNNIFVFWLDARNGQYEVFFAKSPDDGQNFSANKSIFSHPNSSIHLLGNAFGRLITRSPSDDLIFLTFDFYLQTASPFSTDYEVYFLKSQDGGENFTAAKRLSDDPVSPKTRQQNPSLTLLPDGSPVIAWHDFRDGDGKVMLVYSEDEGETFSPNIRINNTLTNNVFSAPTIAADNEGKIHFVRWDAALSPIGVYYTEIDLGLEFNTRKVPYYSQNDPAWESQEYDHANSLDLFCGTTLSQCGCAVTSAAMILKYYGVDQAPNGSSTNPSNLNNWLINREFGYINGDVNWEEIAKYAKAANEEFGTPKLDYLGKVNDQDFDLLENDLNSEKPVILQEPGHFILATDTIGDKYTINDPNSTEKTTLDYYGNSFTGMRRYALTNTNLSAIILSIPFPGKIMIIDSQGRKLGQDPKTGETFNEIQNGNFYLETPLTDDTIENSETNVQEGGNYYIEILDPLESEYTIQVAGGKTTATFLGYDQNAEVSGGEFAIQGKEEFKLDYSPEPGSQIEITQVVDIDIKPGSNLNTVNLKSKGVIPVAILTTPSFDANQVDPLSTKFGPNQAAESHNRGHYEDVDKDGDIDLLLHFKTQETGILKTNTLSCLTGFTFSGNKIEGCSKIKAISK
ncbi:MAG: C39 family peptidase [Candidatus Curtissbacteria bacterium]